MQNRATISPIDNTTCVIRSLASPEQVDETVKRSEAAFEKWKRVPVQTRVGILSKFVDSFAAKKDEIAKELTTQMGRLVYYKRGESDGTEEGHR